MSTWRTGRHLGRTVYRQVDADPSDRDELLGLMDTAELGELVAGMHNEYLDALRRLIGLLHTSAIPEHWRTGSGGNDDEPIHLRDVVDRLCELIEPNTVRSTTAEETG